MTLDSSIVAEIRTIEARAKVNVKRLLRKESLTKSYHFLVVSDA